MAQFVYTMHRVGKVVPPKRHILKNISLSFFPGAKIGVLGLNGAGKSTLLRIMAGIDTDIEGEARPQPGIKIGYLPQEPQLNPEHTVRESVEEAVSEVVNALKGLDEVYAKYAEPDADFDKLAAQQGKYEEIIQAHDGHNLNVQLERAADALRLPDWDAKIANLSGGERRRVALCRLLLKYAKKRAQISGAILTTRTGRPLDRSNLWSEMKRLCGAAGVPPEKVYPHNLRHLFARTFYAKEKDLNRLADILGHASIETTRIYTITTGAECARKLDALGLVI